PRPDELLRLDEGYGLTRIEIGPASPVQGRTLSELGLASWRVQVLGIERNGEYQPVPTGGDRLLAGDFVVVYGAESTIHRVFEPRSRPRLPVVGAGGTLAPASTPQGSASTPQGPAANPMGGPVGSSRGAAPAPSRAGAPATGPIGLAPTMIAGRAPDAPTAS